MTGWIDRISNGMASLNAFWDGVKRAIAKQLGTLDPICIIPFRGYGTADKLYLKGRVLEDQGIKLREENAPVWKNLWNMYRRFESDEIPEARVHVQFGEFQEEVVADREGFFEILLELPEQVECDSLWQTIDLKLLDPCPDPSHPVTTTGEIMMVSEHAQFGVISDIDDTIMRTAATDLLKMIRLAYLGNERTRSPFPGVGEFYQALQQGKSGQAGNPIFYVSSSAWNMYDLFVKFMDFNQVPAGPILLRDIELSPANLLAFAHESHKLEQIQPILQRFPHLPFILIGDTGQKDAEIYQQIVQDYPQRILGIYLRDVTVGNRDRHQTLSIIGDSVQQQGVEWVVFADTSIAARHALQQGWIQK